MLMLPPDNAYDYKITCKSIVMLENVSEMPLCTVSEFAELLQLWLKRTTLLVFEMRERKVTRRNKGEIRALDGRNRYRYRQIKRGERERLTERDRERGKERD